MSDERDRLEQQLDEAFASMRPRAGFESELWSRFGQAPIPMPVVKREPNRWAWFWAAAAVIVVGLLGFFIVRMPHGGGNVASSGTASHAAAPATSTSFGKLPRPSVSASPFGDGNPLGNSSATNLQPSRQFAPVAPAGIVARYREPSQADFDAFAASLGATGQGGRFSGPGYTLLFYPTDAGLGLPAHYVLTPTGPAPTGTAPSEAMARAAADAFASRYRLPVTGQVVSVNDGGPLAIVRYSSGSGPALAIYVRGDGGVFQATGPVTAVVERAPYRLASIDQMRADAHAGPNDPWQLVTVLAYDGEYGYFEPALAFTTAAGRRIVPALDPSQLR
jgi:hypothetical protein